MVELTGCGSRPRADPGSRRRTRSPSTVPRFRFADGCSAACSGFTPDMTFLGKAAAAEPSMSCWIGWSRVIVRRPVRRASSDKVRSFNESQPGPRAVPRLRDGEGRYWGDRDLTFAAHGDSASFGSHLLYSRGRQHELPC